MFELYAPSIVDIYRLTMLTAASIVSLQISSTGLQYLELQDCKPVDIDNNLELELIITLQQISVDQFDGSECWSKHTFHQMLGIINSIDEALRSELIPLCPHPELSIECSSPLRELTETLLVSLMAVTLRHTEMRSEFEVTRSYILNL